MISLIIRVLLLSIPVSYSTAYILNDFKKPFLWKTTNLVLISLLDNPFVLVYSAAPPEESKKLKEKIKKGKKLLEDLNVNLEKIKKSLAEKIEVEKDVLDKIIEIKDDFKEMQVDVTDLPKDLIEKFKEKTIESLKLIMESYGLDKILQKKKAKAEPQADVVDNKVDSKAEKKFEKEL